MHTDPATAQSDSLAHAPPGGDRRHAPAPRPGQSEQVEVQPAAALLQQKLPAHELDAQPLLASHAEPAAAPVGATHAPLTPHDVPSTQSAAA